MRAEMKYAWHLRIAALLSEAAPRLGEKRRSSTQPTKMTRETKQELRKFDIPDLRPKHLTRGAPTNALVAVVLAPGERTSLQIVTRAILRLGAPPKGR